MRPVTTRFVLLALLASLFPLTSRAGPDDAKPSPECLAGHALGSRFEPPEGWFVIRRQNGEIRATIKNRKGESTAVETDAEHRIKHVQWFHPVRTDQDIDRAFARIETEKKAFAAFLVHEDGDASDGEMEYRYEGEGWKRRVHYKAPFFSIAIYRVVREVKEEIVVLPRALGGFTLGEVYAPKRGVTEEKTTALPDGTRHVVLSGGNLYVQLTPDGVIIEIGERSPFGSKPGPSFEALKKEHAKAEVVLDILHEKGYMLSFRDSRTVLRARGDESQEVKTLTDRALREKHPLPERKKPPEPPRPPEPESEPTRESREEVPACLEERTTSGTLCGHVLGEPFRAPEGAEVEDTARNGAAAHAYALADGGKVLVGTDVEGKVIYVSLAYDDIAPDLFETIVERQTKRFGELKRTDHSKTRRDRIVRTVAFNDGRVDRCLDYREGKPGDLLVQVEPALAREAMGLTLGASYQPSPGETARERDWGTEYTLTLENGVRRRVGVDVAGRIVFVGSKRPDPDGSVFTKTRASLIARYPFQLDLRSDQITCSDGCTVLSMSSYRGLVARTIYDARTRYDALRVNGIR